MAKIFKNEKMRAFRLTGRTPRSIKKISFRTYLPKFLLNGKSGAEGKVDSEEKLFYMVK